MWKYQNKLNSPGTVNYPPESWAKIMFNKSRVFIKRVVKSKMQNAMEASHHLDLMENCETFYLHVFVFVSGSLRLLLWPNSREQLDFITSLFDWSLNFILGGDYFNTNGWKRAWIIYENAKISIKIELNNWFPGKREFFSWH